MTSYKFGSTTDPDKAAQIYGVCALEWGCGLNAKQFGAVERRRFEDNHAHHRYNVGYYYEDNETGEVVALTFVLSFPGFFKHVDTSLTAIPSLLLIGVQPMTVLLVGHVFTAKKARGNGLASKLVANAIAATEDDFLRKEMARDPELARTVTNANGSIDHEVANHYMAKKYVWYLNSAVGSYYERFGFKGYPMDAFMIPFLLVSDDETNAIVKAMALGEIVNDKLIKVLTADCEADQALIRYILQNKELQIVADLNKTNYHPQLSQRRRSLNLLTQIQMAGKFSNPAMASMQNPMEPEKPHRVAFTPDYHFLHGMHLVEQAQLQFQWGGDQAKYHGIVGAIITNHATGQLHYVLWATQKYHKFFILLTGRIDYNPHPEQAVRHRRPLIVALMAEGELLHNYSDLELVIRVACVVGRQRLPNQPGLYICATDLPVEMPEAANLDFVTNYLARQVPKDSEHQVKLYSGDEFAQQMLPLLKKFGSKAAADVDFDWVHPSRLNWG